MAELHDHQLKQLDKLDASEQHETNRLDNAARTARQSVTEVGKYIAGDPDDAKKNGLDLNQSTRLDFSILDARNNHKRNKAEGVKADIRNQVMDVLAASGEQFTRGLNSEAYAPNLERQAWQHSQVDVLDMIESDHEEGVSSLRVLEGYEAFLKTAKSKTNARWERQKGKNEKALEKMPMWTRAVKHFFEGSPEIRNQYFNEDVDAALSDMFATLDNKITVLKSDANERLTDMTERIEDVWDAAMFDPDRQAQLWDQIKGAAENKSDLDSLDLSEFGINSDQDKIDFVECLLTVDFVKEKLGIAGDSAEKNQDQDQNLKTAQAMEAKAAGLTAGKMKSLREGFAKDEYVSDGTAISTEALVKIILEDQVNQGKNIQTDFFDGTDETFLGKSTQLSILLQALNPNDFQSPEAKQAYVNWYESQVNTLTEENDYYNDAASEAQREALEGSTGVIKQLQTEWSKAKRVDIGGGRGSLKPDTFHNGLKNLLQNSHNAFHQFELAKAELPPADQELLGKTWENVMTRVKQLSEIADTWVTEAKQHQKWQDDSGTIETQIGRYESLIEDKKEGKGSDKATNKIVALERAYQASKPELSPIPDYDDTTTSIQVMAHNSLKPRLRPSKQPRSSWDTTLRDQLVEECRQAAEKVFLARMEKNDQYEILKKCQEGAGVEIECVTEAAYVPVKFPKQLDSAAKHDCRVVRTEGNMVLVEDADKTITVTGPAVKGGQPFRNAVITDKGTGAQHMAIITNMRIA